MCHSDIHMARGDWGDVSYPLVVGHEIAGTVTAVGDSVTRHAVGDRVGVGCLVDSCRTCDHCRAGLEQYCLNGATDTYNGVLPDGSITQGGYSTHIVVNEVFVLRVPMSLPFEAAGPLMCAGITTWSPLRHWGVGPGSKVAVVGLGGLGHLAVKLAHALGAEVTVLSRSLAKAEDAARLGADRSYATSAPATFDALAGAFDIVLNTVSAGIEFDRYIPLLRLDGTLVTLGASAEQSSLMMFGLAFSRVSIAGSMIGGIAETQELLDFCAEHGIAPEVEVFPADEVNTAWERVLDADVRYRAVLDLSALS